MQLRVAPPQLPRYEAAGGSGSVTVSCADGCEWAAASQVSWIMLTAGASGVGSGSVTFNVAPNTSAQGRSGTLSVAGPHGDDHADSGSGERLGGEAHGGAELASESIVAAFGAGLATTTQVATTVPLPTELAGTSVKVRDSAGTERLASLFFVAPAQINYLIPPGTAPGAATVIVTSNGNVVATGAVKIAAVAPGLFAANANGQGVAAGVALRVRANGAQVYEPIARFDATRNQFVAVPLDLGPTGEQVFLILFGTGWRGRSSLTAATCKLGGLDASVLYAGVQGDFIGVDQVNIGALPRNLAGRGEVDIVLTVDGKAANTVRVNIK